MPQPGRQAGNVSSSQAHAQQSKKGIWDPSWVICLEAERGSSGGLPLRPRLSQTLIKCLKTSRIERHGRRYAA